MTQPNKNTNADDLARMSGGFAPSQNGQRALPANSPAPSSQFSAINNPDSSRLFSAKQNPLEKRRTLIPILLTVGVILMLAGLDVFRSGPDDPMSDLFPSWAAIVLLLLGGLTVAVAIFNMLYVKHFLTSASASETLPR